VSSADPIDDGSAHTGHNAGIPALRDHRGGALDLRRYDDPINSVRSARTDVVRLALPRSVIGHAGPRLFDWQRIAFLQ
jgi:hypothetical protein